MRRCPDHTNTLPPTKSLGAQLIADYESRGDGVQWSNVMQPLSADDSFTFGIVLGMLLLDSIIYATLTWYIEAVFPGEFGVPRKWYFPFTVRGGRNSCHTMNSRFLLSLPLPLPGLLLVQRVALGQCGVAAPAGGLQDAQRPQHGGRAHDAGLRH